MVRLNKFNNLKKRHAELPFEKKKKVCRNWVVIQQIQLMIGT